MTRNEIEQYADKHDVQLDYKTHLKRYEIGVEGELYKRNLTWLQVKKCLETEHDEIEKFRKQCRAMEDCNQWQGI